jgi:phage/plasmid-like protein (TIGR03299 family)
MSHEVENMFSVKETPWHGLGRIVQEAPTAAEAIKLAGLDWKVVPTEIARLETTPDGLVQNHIIRSHRAFIRDTDSALMGVLGQNYTPLQNSEAFAFFNPFLESGLASFETAGSLRSGKTVWILAKLNKAPIEVGKGDGVQKMLLLSNSHDGSLAVRVSFTPVRVVCANTLAMAHFKNDDNRYLRISHSKHVAANLTAVQEMVNAADAKFEATAEQYRALSRKDINQADLQQYVDLVFGYSDKDEERRALARKRATEDIQRLFETGRGQDLPGAKGTYWGLYNAVTEMLSYEKGRTTDSRLNSLWFGENRNLNQKALDLALVGAS